MSDPQFVFRNNDKVGVADAKMDKKVLLETFIDTGDYSVIKDFERPERFVLGRTGVGKTALITKLQQDVEGIITIEPESLSLGYISNSTIIQSLTVLGVDLSLFYRMLWRHVLVVEVLKHHFGIVDEDTQLTVVDKLKNKFSRSKQGRVHERAIEYMEKWGSSFWKATDLRIKEVKETFETEVKGKVGVDAKRLSAEAGKDSRKVKEQTSEIAHKAQEVVYSVQMKELSDIMNMLDDAIGDKQKKYFLLIDRLDENWVDETVRYSLIKALLETVKDFEKVEQIKPLVVLRDDLLARVYDQTMTAGFQEEKFSSLNLHVSWTPENLLKMLDERINYLVKQRYTKQVVTHKELMPSVVNGIEISEYLVSRTLLRPRDMIDFFNHCIETAVGSPAITEEMLIKAERDYSRSRRSAIHDEWRSVYATINKWESLITSREAEFMLGEVSQESIEEIALSYSLPLDHNEENCVLAKSVGEFLKGNIDINNLRHRIIIAFYIVGYLGVELSGGVIYWVNETKKIIKPEELTQETIIKIHPMFHSSFSVRNAA